MAHPVVTAAFAVSVAVAVVAPPNPETLAVQLSWFWPTILQLNGPWSVGAANAGITQPGSANPSAVIAIAPNIALRYFKVIVSYKYEAIDKFDMIFCRYNDFNCKF